MSQPQYDTSQITPGGVVGPRHVAIIMDGNGRWAAANKRPRVFGHHEGVEALRRTVRAAADLGIEYLTVFGFSTENWSRPADEVEALLELLRLFVNRDLERLNKEGVRVRIIGEREGLSGDIQKIIDRAESSTCHNTKLQLTIAFNYGGQAEIVTATKRIADEILSGRMKAADVSTATVAKFLHTRDLPAPDLLIRTSGEKRISNFMLWQCAYTEFVFQDVYWPDYGLEHLKSACDEYSERDRRYGGRDHERPA